VLALALGLEPLFWALVVEPYMHLVYESVLEILPAFLRSVQRCICWWERLPEMWCVSEGAVLLQLLQCAME
jgi:hypothetical protein